MPSKFNLFILVSIIIYMPDNLNGEVAAESAIFEAKLAIIEVKKTGDDITELWDMLKSAKDAFEKGNFSEVRKCSESIKFNADQRLSLYRTALQSMGKASESIDKLRSIGAQYDEIGIFLLSSREEFDNYHYENCIKYATDCIIKVEKVYDLKKLHDYIDSNLDDQDVKNLMEKSKAWNKPKSLKDPD